MEKIISVLSSLFLWIQSVKVEWKSFRRPNYFVSRQHDCYQRFRRIIGTFSKDMQDSTMLASMERKRNMLLNPPGLVAISNVTDSRVLESIHRETATRADDSVQREGTQQGDTSCVTILLCHIVVPQLDKWKEIVDVCLQQLLKIFTLDWEDKSMFAMLIICDIQIADIPQDIISEVLSYITDYLTQVSSCMERSPRVLVGHDASKLQEEIGIALEDVVMTMFDDIYSYVERFIVHSHSAIGSSRSIPIASPGVKGGDDKKQSTSSDCSDEVVEITHPLLNESLVEEAISGCFSKDNCELFLYLYKSVEPVEDVVPIVLQTLADRIRCALVPTLALRFRLVFWMCNQIFTDLKFFDKIGKAASSDTREQIRKFYYDKALSELEASFLLHNVKKDLTPVLELVEKTLSKAEGFIDIMRRLQHEVRGYFSQSITRKDALQRIPSLSKAFKTDITQIPNVFGVGTVFGDCEVHVTTSKPEEFSKVKASVDIVAKKHSVTFPVRIKQVRSVKYNHR